MITAKLIIKGKTFEIPMELSAGKDWQDYLNAAEINLDAMMNQLEIFCPRCIISIAYDEFPKAYADAVEEAKNAKEDENPNEMDKTLFCQNVLSTIVALYIQHTNIRPKYEDFTINLDTYLSELRHINERGCEEHEVEAFDKAKGIKLNTEAKTQCPTCDANVNAVTSEHGNKPKGGDISICLYCQTILEFNDDLSVKEADLQRFDDSFRAHLKNLQQQLRRQNQRMKEELKRG